MSELVLVFAVCVFSLLVAGFQTRGLLEYRTAQHELERLLAAVQRACADFLWQETRILVLLVAIVGTVAACPLAIWGATGGKGELVAWNLGALCVGAAGGIAVAHATRWAAARATTTSLEALREGTLESASRATLRGAAAVAIIADAASLVITSGFFGSHYLYLSLMGRADVSEAIGSATRSLPAAALGALCAAAVFQVGGSSFHTAAGIASTAARARHSHIADDEEQNPALVAELVGNYVGGTVCRSTDVFSALLLGNCGLVVLAGLVARDNTSLPISVLALAGLPIVIRGMGLLAATVAMGSLRFDGQLSLSKVFAAGRASHALMLATGLLGAALWMLGEPLYLVHVGAGALGIMAGLVSTALLLSGARPLGSVTAEAAPFRLDTSVARALGVGLQYTWLPLLIVGSCLGGAWLLGTRGPIERGGAFALVIAVAAMLGASAFNLCESLFSTMGETIRVISGLRRGEFDEQAQDRARELHRAGNGIGNLGHTQCILGGASAALLASIMLPSLASSGQSPDLRVAAAVSFAHPIVIVGGMLGASSLLFHVGGVLRLSSRAASALDRNLRERLERASGLQDCARPLPSYRDSVQLAAAGATEALLPLVLVGLLAPFVVGILLRVVYGPLGSALTAHGLMALGTIAALTGCCVALAAQGTLVALSAEREMPQAGFAFGSPGSDAAQDLMGRCVGPAAILGLKVSVVSSIATVPLLFST